MSVSATTTTTNVFEIGSYNTLLRRVELCSATRLPGVPPPKPLLITFPNDNEAGEFPLLIFLHGYLIYNSFYSQFIQHVASHGFIVIAPQLYTVAGADATDEITATAAITNWLSNGGLQPFLPPHIHPNLSKLALAGHSRGGKSAFALALGKTPYATTALKFSAIIGIDPVDGMDKGSQTPPPVLTYIPNSFSLEAAAMIIGSGLGEMRRNPLLPACAPKGVNHYDFFRECTPPVCYFVAKNFGHLDVLDDVTGGIRGRASYCLCRNGEKREPMRRFVAGAVVAFMNAYLNGDQTDLMALKNGVHTLPVELQTVEFCMP